MEHARPRLTSTQKLHIRFRGFQVVPSCRATTQRIQAPFGLQHSVDSGSGEQIPCSYQSSGYKPLTPLTPMVCRWHPEYIYIYNQTQPACLKNTTSSFNQEWRSYHVPFLTSNARATIGKQKALDGFPQYSIDSKA